MNPTYQLILTTEDLRRVTEKLAALSVVGFDTETTSLDPYDGRVRLIQFAAQDAVYIIDLDRFRGEGDMAHTNALASLRELLAAARPVKIAHNAKFDAKWIHHTLGVELGAVFDTLLASQLISAGSSDDRHSLEAVVARYLGQMLDKSSQLSDWSGELSDTQLEYAGRDASVLLPLREAMITKLKAEDLVRVAQLEFECVMPVAALELAGFYLDAARWREQMTVIEHRRKGLAEDLQAMLSEGTSQGSLFSNARTEVNIDSHTQLTAALTRLGVPVPDSTRNWKLQPLAADYPVVAKLLEYRTVQKALTSYGGNILEEINSHTGRIHANFHQIGAPTGRMSCTRPNIQQVPHEVEYRRCFRAPEGRKLIIADYSQVELRILAEVTGDAGFIEAFRTGADLHRVTSAQVFGVKLEDVTAEQRSFAKRLNFGVVYGIGANRFSAMTGLSLNEAEDIMRRYFKTYHALNDWLRAAAQSALREREARTMAGRLARFTFDPADKQAASLAQRNGKNMPIQGCISGETHVFEQHEGFVKIQSLVGKEISVWDGERFARGRVAHSGLKQLVKVEFWGGYHIECSPDHKFLTTDVNGRTRWRTAQEFVKGCYVRLANPVGEWSVTWNLPPFVVGNAHNASRVSLADAAAFPFELGAWMGRLASDGTLSGNQASLLVAQHEKTILEQVKTWSGMFGHVNERTVHGGKGTLPIHRLSIHAKAFAAQLRLTGIKSRIPDFAWRSREVLAGYLRGMFDGDGTVTSDGASLCFGQGGRHLAWAREIQQALLLFGVRSRINICADRINVCILKRDSALFASNIGFINQAKQAKAEAIQVGKRDGKIYGRAARIKSVTYTDQWIEMYDVVDSETERFAANGLVTHNSSADIFKRAMRLFHDRTTGTSTRIVNVVHDEIVVEVDANEADATMDIVKRAMCEAGAEFVKQVPVEVEACVADEWVK